MGDHSPAGAACETEGALAGIRVVEFAHVVSAPLVGMLLADLGAEVIKVESPERPDMLRRAGAGPQGADSAVFHTVNRGKYSVRLDLTDPACAEQRDELLRSADVLLENYRPGTARRLGIDYERASGLNPGLVYGSITGFGDTGPLAEQGGYDLVAQAMSGLMSVTGPLGGDAFKCGVPITDVAAALHLTVGILGALRARDRCGHGQRVTCSLLGAGLSFAVWEASEHWATGATPQRLGNAHRALAPYQAVPALDRDFVLAANTDDMFRRSAEVFGHPEWAADPRFARNADRLGHREELSRLLEEAATTEKAAHWVSGLLAAGVPAGEVLDVSEALAHPQAHENGMVVDLEDGATGVPVRVLGNPVRLSHTAVSYRAGAPALGADDALLLVDGRASQAPRAGKRGTR